MQNKNVLMGGTVVLVLLVLGIFFFRPHPVPTLPTSTNATSTSASTTTDGGNSIAATVSPGVQILPVSSNIPTPDLNHAVVYSPSLQQDALVTLKSEIASTTASLRSNPSQGNMWLRLALYYKAAEDYQAAESVWIYLTKVAPSNPVAFQDLGDLYQNFVVDYPKAESNYLQAIKLDPKNIGVYSDLYTLYRYQYKTNTTAVADILAQGLKANPNNPDLLNLQAQLQSGT